MNWLVVAFSTGTIFGPLANMARAASAGGANTNKTNHTEPAGGTVKVEYMHNVSLSANRGMLFTFDNSTLFTSSAPLPPADGTWGELIPFSPLDACGPLQLSNYTKRAGSRIQFDPIGPYPHVVALVARGNCSFEDKFDYVDDVPNVIGMVMYDLPGGGNLSNYIELSSFRLLNIPGFLIEYGPGVQLKHEVDRLRLEDKRNPDDPRWIKVILRYTQRTGPIQSFLQYVMLLVMLLLCGAFLVSVYMHYRIYRMQRRLDENRQIEARNAISIDEAFLEKIPVRRFRKTRSPVSLDLNDGAGVSKMSRSNPTSMAPVETEDDDHLIHAVAPPNETCPICLDEFGQYETLNELPCGHFYHISCIRPWLQHRSPCCPLCKEDVRDAFITLPPLREERPVTELIKEALGIVFRQVILCGCLRAPREGQAEATTEEHSPANLAPTAPMSEIRIMTPTQEVDQVRLQSSPTSLRHVPLHSPKSRRVGSTTISPSRNSL